MLENTLKKITDNYVKVDITTDVHMFTKVKEGGNTMPACLFYGDNRYIVSAQTPAKVPNIKGWLESLNCPL